MKLLVLGLSAFFVLGSAACTHTVLGTGSVGESTNATEPLPGLGEACDCVDSIEADAGNASCCEGDLVCGATAGSLATCNTAGCTRKGVCMSPGEATAH